MTNLTISLDEAIVRGARIRAIQEGTSLSAKVREYLRHYVEGSGAQEAQLRRTATAQLMNSISKASSASKHAQPAKVKGATLRDALYEDDFRSKARTK